MRNILGRYRWGKDKNHRRDEALFRGLARVFCGPVRGEMTAMILFNVMFTMLDWYNFGFSFILGLICIWAYKKTGHLLAPMIAHGGINIISIVYWIVVTK